MSSNPEDGLKILVVDDDEFIRAWITVVLTNIGHTVISAADGREGLASFEHNQPDLVLLDQVMPGMSGFEVAKVIRAANAWVPIIFLSAYSDNDEVVKGLRAGADDYLFKPVNDEILGAKIHAYQDRLEMSKKLVEQNSQLLNYREQIKEEQDIAREFIDQYISLDKINDPLVRFLLRPADNFSGDLIAVARTPDKRLHVLLADSAGHGLTSALAVIPITQPFYQMTARGFDVPFIVKEINRCVRDYLPLPRYVAAAVLSIDPEQQVIKAWNGGCPAALLFSRDGEILHRFKSRQLPLGVLPADQFDASVEYFDYASQSARLLLCSDGATELLMSQGIDHAEIVSGMASLPAQDIVDGLADVCHLALKGRMPSDDIALLVVDCPPAPALPQKVDAPRAALVSKQDAASSAAALVATLWEFTSTFTASQLQRLDVIPFLINVSAQIDGEVIDGKTFLVLSELFNNALDHGLLKLDSALKNHLDGMDRYFMVRAERLAQLESGQIYVSLVKQQCEGGKRLKIDIRDSGEGFDHAAIGHGNIALNEDLSGRGVMLVASLCRELRYLGNGSEVHALLDLLAEQRNHLSAGE